jgi:hypothetical protein
MCVMRRQSGHSIFDTAKILGINQLRWLRYWHGYGAPSSQLRITPHLIHEPFPHILMIRDGA